LSPEGTLGFDTKNTKVYLAAQSPEKAAAVIKRLEEETKKSAIFLRLNLADLTSVRKAAEMFLSQESRLHILFNKESVRKCFGKRLSFTRWIQWMVYPIDQLFRSSVHSRLSADRGWFFEVLAILLFPCLKSKYMDFLSTDRKNSKEGGFMRKEAGR
jgi:hypothetical protein